MSDDYWFEQRYQAMYLALHGEVPPEQEETDEPA